ncbi:uncharacterized protein LOC135835583 [Planococcus citri]|uniref:uncharacterized protein LOC135835583 n=1 Tax=Planococcus citri TaxID=170843 RepID=UPI0031F920E1
MMQHKFLLFSAVCCCLLQAMLCDLPPSAMFRPKFGRQSSISSTPATSAVSSSDAQGIQNQLSQLAQNEGAGSKSDIEVTTVKKEDSVESTSQETPTSDAVSPKDPATEVNTEEGDSSSPSKKKKSKTPSRKNSNSKDPLDISDLDELRERSKDVIRDLLRNQNANRALTLLATNARYLLENKVSSNMILTHTGLIKDTLMNEEAKEIIKDVRMDILSTFLNPETPEKVKTALTASKNYLADETMPALVRKRFKMLKKMIKNKKTYSAFVSVKNAIMKFMETGDVRRKIAKGFQLLDFGIHFDPNNLLGSLGLSIFKR